MQKTNYEEIERGSVVEKLRESFFTGENNQEIQHKMNAELDEMVTSGADITAVKRIKIGRNDPCPCGSGKKFKKCCIDKAR